MSSPSVLCQVEASVWLRRSEKEDIFSIFGKGGADEAMMRNWLQMQGDCFLVFTWLVHDHLSSTIYFKDLCVFGKLLPLTIYSMFPLYHFMCRRVSVLVIPGLENQS